MLRTLPGTRTALLFSSTLDPFMPTSTPRAYPMQGAHTALFVARVARGTSGTDWHLSTIGEVDHTARDFGSLGARARTHAHTHSQPLPPRRGWGA